MLLKKRRANFSSERRTARDAVAEQRRGPSRGCGFASARRHLGVAPAGSRVARGKMGSAPGLTDVERPRASAEATTPTKAVDAMRVSTGHRLSFGIGGVSENDPKPAIGTHEFGETVRERQHASVTRRASRIARRYPRVVLPPLFRMVNFPRAAVGSRLGSRANARATLPKAQLTTPDVTSFLYRQAMFGASGDAVHGADASDKERTPQTKFKTTTAVLGKSPNTVFSPLSVMSEATAPGDNSLDSSFSDDVAEIATEGQRRDVASKVLAAPASPRDDAEVGASESATPPVAADVDAADEEDLSHSWLRRRRPSSSVSPALSPNAPLLTSLAPSADEAMIHRRVSELRIALRAAEGALDKTRARFEDSEANRREAEAESAALRARVWTLEGAEALSGSRLHDGSLDLLRGELLNEATAELEEAARATADAESRASDAVDALRQAEDAATAVVSAANAEVEALSLEAAQARFRAQAESRDAAAAREARDAAEASRAEAEAEAAKWRDAGERESAARAVADEAARVALAEAEEAREAAANAIAREGEAAQHNAWLQQRVRELEDAEGADAGARYGAELRRLREKLAADAAKAEDVLAAERAVRRELEAKLAHSEAGDRGQSLDSSVAAAGLEEQLRDAREETAELRRRLASANAPTPDEDSWDDALGLASDEEASERGDAVVSAKKPASASKEVQASDASLEDARREIDELKRANAALLEQQQAAAAAAAAATSPAAIDAALSRNNQAWAAKLAQAELAAAEAEEKVERAARRVAVLEAECAAARKDVLDVQTRELAVRDREVAVNTAVEAATSEAELAAEKRWEARVADAERAASDARAALARVVQAEEERERESAEAEKEWEDKLTEARRAATEAESRRAEAESLVVEAKEAATRAILRVEEEQQEHLTEARRTAAVAEAKMAKAEADAAEAKKCEADAAVRAAELEKECAEAQREIELLREREATAELAAEAEVAFAALEAGEEAKMEAAEALAQARAEALTARGELDALRESLRVSEMERLAPAPVAAPVPPSPTATPQGSVFDEPHKSSESPMRPAGVTVVQMTDDDTGSESGVEDAKEESLIERALRRDREERLAIVPGGPAREASEDEAESPPASPVRAGSGTAAAAARRLGVDPEVLRSLTSSPRSPGGKPAPRVEARPARGARLSSSDPDGEDDICRMSSEDEAEGEDSTAAEWREPRESERRPARSSTSSAAGSGRANARASEAFAAVAASARAAVTSARRAHESRASASRPAPAKPSPAMLAAAALAATPRSRVTRHGSVAQGGASALEAMRASRAKTAAPSRRRAAAQTTTARGRGGAGAGITDTWGRPTGTWGHNHRYA